MEPICSIIIRTKNEERWIGRCLKAIHNQTFKNYEIILVDNMSVDKTVEKAQDYNVDTVLQIEKYLPGKAINRGIDAAKGKYIVLISAHCIPVNNLWLENLVSALEEDQQYAGVYGRQEPMSFSSPSDKRDLLLVFGLDRKVQIKDSFFHNANSIIRKEILEKIEFDGKTTNIEDRLWGQEVINQGYKLLYEPQASVFHYHGIHQDGNHERLQNVVNIISTHQKDYKVGRLSPKNLNIIAILPIKGKSKILGKHPRLFYTIKAALHSKYIKTIYVSTDSEENRKLAREYGAIPLSLRPDRLSEDHVSVGQVDQFALEEIESEYGIVDLVVHLEETFPFRKPGLLDELIMSLLNEGSDSILPTIREPNTLWREDDAGTYSRLENLDSPRKFKERAFIAIKGLGCITHPQHIRKGEILGQKISLMKIEDQMARIEIRGDDNKEIFLPLLEEYNK